LLTLALFVFLFVITIFPLEGWLLPYDLLMRLDPLVALVTMVSSRAFIVPMLISLSIVAVTLVFGRFFCGWICPMGTSIDIFTWLWTRKRKKGALRKRKDIRLPWLKYFILVMILLAALFSLNLAWLLDPLAIFVRSITYAVYPVITSLASGGLNGLLNIEFLQEPLYSLQDISLDILFPVNQPRYHQGIFFLMMFLGILALDFLASRFWCSSLCPLGALLGLVAKIKPFNRWADDKCIDCQLCYKDCKTRAVTEDYRSSLAAECVMCWQCEQVCPTKAVRFTFRNKDINRKVDLSRRRLIWAGAAGVATIGAFHTAYTGRDTLENLVRPPGSLPEPDFLDTCIRCGECTRICATNGRGLQPALLESGWEGIWTPVFDFRYGYCEHNCNLCTLVCPTDAIRELDLATKQQTIMGTAYFDRSRCIPWYRNVDCIVCEEHCPTSPKAIILKEEEDVTVEGKKTVVKRPYMVEDRCIGCGVCVTKCPVKGTAGIFCTSARERRFGTDPATT
jgi:polyferredoxin